MSLNIVYCIYLNDLYYLLQIEVQTPKYSLISQWIPVVTPMMPEAFNPEEYFQFELVVMKYLDYSLEVYTDYDYIHCIKEMFIMHHGAEANFPREARE